MRLCILSTWHFSLLAYSWYRVNMDGIRHTTQDESEKGGGGGNKTKN